MATSDPTLRAVFAEDSAALIGLLIAAAGLAGHQITESAVPDAIGSILVGVLLGIVAIALINRNRRFLVGQQSTHGSGRPRCRRCWSCPRWSASPTCGWNSSARGSSTWWRTSTCPVTMRSRTSRFGSRDLEAKVSSSPAVVDTTLSLSAPDEPSLVV